MPKAFLCSYTANNFWGIVSDASGTYSNNISGSYTIKENYTCACDNDVECYHGTCDTSQNCCVGCTGDTQNVSCGGSGLNLCEVNCTAPLLCDEVAPGGFISSCTSAGNSYFADVCGSASPTATRCITIDATPNTILGYTYALIDTNWGSVTVLYNGTEWSVIGFTAAPSYV